MTIAGGEPMARPDWPDVIEAAAKNGIIAGMLTNGIAFDDDAARISRAIGGDGLHGSVPLGGVGREIAQEGPQLLFLRASEIPQGNGAV